MIGDAFASVLSAAQQGDETAFARLWRDLNPLLVRYLTLGGEPAEDVAADTWVTVVKGLRRFTGDEAAWRAWVFTTARRRAVDAGRRRARAAQVELGASAWPVEQLAPDAADEALEHLDTAAALLLTAQLPALQAEVVLLRVVAGLPVEHVARVVGRSAGAVRVATHRGLRSLALILEREGVTRSGAGALRE